MRTTGSLQCTRKARTMSLENQIHYTPKEYKEIIEKFREDQPEPYDKLHRWLKFEGFPYVPEGYRLELKPKTYQMFKNLYYNLNKKRG